MADASNPSKPAPSKSSPSKKGSRSALTPQRASSAHEDSVKRRVKDVCIDIHEFIQKWEETNNSGFQAVNSLASLHSQFKSYSEGNLDDNAGVAPPECFRKCRVKILTLRESLFSDLNNSMEKFGKLHDKLRQLVENLQAVYFIELSTDTEKDSKETPLFGTWTSEMFYRSARKILNMYSKEWLVKQYLSKNFFNPKVDASKLNISVQLWLHQPYLDQSVNTTLESMLLEAGVK